eukprot:GFUD01001426.1.p1 GENE.GFUD01001426.1~~GFUD01001426.1.p1  ORF type:complete len:659 (+),score=100.48 GFUD01001426.1:158-1978(+)
MSAMISRVSVRVFRTLKSRSKVASRLLNLNPRLSCLISERTMKTSAMMQDPSQPTGLVDKEDAQFVIRSPYADVVIPEMNVADFVWKHAESYEDNVALVCGMTGRQYTYGMAKAMSEKFGSSLKRLGAQKGDVIAMILPNIPEFPVAFLGSVGAGLTVTTINPTYRAEEIGRQLDNSGAKYVLTIGLFLQVARQASAELTATKIEQIIVLGMDETPDDCKSFMSMMISDDGSMYRMPGETIDPLTDVVVMPYSSGTTGPAKGVCLTHYNLIANCCQVVSPEVSDVRSTVETGSQEITLAVLPFFHIYAMTTIMIMGLHMGLKVVTLPKFEPEMYVKALTTYRPTLLNLVPPLCNFLASDQTVKAQHLSSVKFVTGGAAPFGATMISNFMAKVAPNIIKFQEGFGMTETSPVTHVQPKENGFLGGCGFPVPNTMAKVVDIESGEILPPGADGELCVSGPQVMLGYHRNKRATKNTIKDGWLYTGDMARYREDGQFVIVDRLKELIKVKGYQVAPSELEDQIRQYEGIVDVAVTAVPDERAGELPRAYVIRKNRKIQERDIMKFVAAHVAPHKKLGGVMFVDSLPKNQTGKVLRRELKAQVFKGSFGY